MKYLITGSSGFLASSLSEYLANSNDLYLTGRGIPVYSDEKVRFIGRNDIFLTKIEFDAVFHLAAYIPLMNEDDTDKMLFETNIEYTQRLCKEINKKVFILSSSVSVYGTLPNNLLIDESSMINNPSSYGISKLWAEQIVRKLPDYRIVRFSSLYGSNMKEHTLIPNYVNQALNTGIISVWGDGSRKQNYLNVADAVKLLFCVKEKGENGIYLGSDIQSFSNIEIASIVAGLTGAKIEFSGVDNSTSLLYDNSKTRKNLDWEPEIKIEQGISNYIEWKKRQF